jgi:hypothetical protein
MVSNIQHDGLEIQKGMLSQVCFIGDIFIEIMQVGYIKDTRVARINYNLAFLDHKNGQYTVTFDGKKISKSS